jgi:MFS family permease
MVHSDFRVLICGDGDAAQVATALFAARYQTIAMSLTTHAAQEWKAALGQDEFELVIPRGAALDGSKVIQLDEDDVELVKSKPAQITDDPSVAKDVDLIVLVSSPLDHGKYLEALAPHMRPKTIVAAMPLRPDADHMFWTILGEKANTMVFCGYEALPWIIRITEWGKKACIIGTQDKILAAVVPQTAAGQALQILQSLDILGVRNVEAGRSVRSVFLRNPAYICHPGIMFGCWCPDAWDGKPVDSVPLFYSGMDGYTETVLLQMGSETQAICKRITELSQTSDLMDVPEMKEFMISAFASSIRDTSTLRSCLQTNSLYNDVKHACLEADGGVVPDFQHSYLSEDVPIGLAFVKGLAQQYKIPTPTIDKVLAWAQRHLGLEIMVDGELNGRDLHQTCAPRALGITRQSPLYQARLMAEAKTRTIPTPAITPLTSATRMVLVPADAAATDPCFYGWAVVGVCTVCLMFSSTGGSMLMGMCGARIRNELGFSKLGFGLLFLVAAISASPIQPMLGTLMDQYGGRVCIPAAQVVLGLALAWGSVVQAGQSTWLLYAQCFAIMFILRTIAQGALNTFPQACVQQWFGRRRGRALSIMNWLEYLGLFVLLHVAYIAANDKSWRHVVWNGALSNMCLAPLSVMLLRQGPECMGLHPDGQILQKIALGPAELEDQTEIVSEDTQASGAAEFPPRSFRIFWLYTFVHSLIMVGSEMYMEEVLDQSFYLTSGEITPLAGNQAIACIFMPLAVGGVLTQLFIGELMDRFAATVKRLPVALLCLGIFVLAFSNLALIVVDSPGDAVLLGIARGISNGISELMFVSGLIFPALGVPRSRIGTALGYNQLAYILGAGMGPLVFGLYSETFGNYWGVLLLTSVPAFALGLLLTLKLVKPQ